MTSYGGSEAATDSLASARPFDYLNPSLGHAGSHLGRSEGRRCYSFRGFVPCPEMCRNPCGPPLLPNNFAAFDATGRTTVVVMAAAMNGSIAWWRDRWAWDGCPRCP